MTNTVTEVMPIELTDLPPVVPGTDWQWTFWVMDDNGAPVDTTAWTAKMQFRPDYNGELIKELTTSSGITMTAGSGRFDVLLADTDTALVDVPHMVWDIIVTDDTGLKTCPFKGRLQVERVVTK